MITTQKALRAAFWAAHPDASRRLIRDYTGTGRMYCTDTRVAWCDYVDSMARSGQVSQALAARATLRPARVSGDPWGPLVSRRPARVQDMGFTVTVTHPSGRTAVYWVPARYDVARVYAAFPPPAALAWGPLVSRRPASATFHIREV